MSRESVVNKSVQDKCNIDEYINVLNELLDGGVDVEYPAGLECGHSILVNETGQEYLEGLVDMIIKDVRAAEQSKRDDFVDSAKYLNDVLTKTKEESKMTQQSNRRVVTVELIDDDPGLPVDLALVAKYENVITEDDNETTIRGILMEEDVAGKLMIHNDARTEEVDVEILKRTGQTVNLRPVKLKDLRWVVR